MSAAGRLAGSQGVAEWFIEKITNVAGQSITLSYLQDANATYLSSVQWGVSGEFAASFVYVARPDALVSWKRGFGVETRLLLDHVDVTVGGNLLRRYALAYDFGLPVSRLASVQCLGTDGKLALPTVSFSYQALSQSQLFSMGSTGAWSLANSSAAIMDLDGDGFADLVDMTRGAQRYYHNTGAGFADPVNLAVPDADSSEVRFIDTQGDGIGRLVVLQDSNWNLYQFSGTRATALETPMPGTAGQPLSDAMEPGATPCDINGDGRTDLLRRLDANTLSVRFSDGNSLGEPVSAIGLPEDSAGETRYVQYNGDGVMDAVILHPDSMDVYTGHGDGSFELAPESPVFYPLGTVATTASLLVGDVNRDGLADLLCLAGGDVYWYTGSPAGTFSGTPIHISSPLGGAPTTGVTLADVNGNGTFDVVWSINGTLQVIDIAGGAGAGLLASISNGMGETLRLGYSASAQLALQAAQAGNPWVSNLHMTLPVVTTMNQDPGGGDPVRTTTYGIRDGFWDTSERRLGGFLSTSATQVGSTADTTLVVQESHIAGTGLERVLRGKVSSQQHSSGSGETFSQSTSTWQALSINNLDPSQPLLLVAGLIDEVGLLIEGTTTPVQTHAATVYDGEGNAAQRSDDGRLDIPGDESIDTWAYVSNDTTWVRNVLVQHTLMDANNVLAASTSTLYDGGDAPLALGSITVGWPRLTQGWLASEQRWVTLTASNYDAFGNAIETYEHGQWRSHVYDAAGVLQLSESMQPNPNTTLTWTIQWDSTLQKVSTITGPDGVPHQASYDALGRTIGLATSGTVEQEYSYSWLSPQPTTSVTVHDGAAGDRVVTKYFNGGGDLIYEVSHLDDSNAIVGRWRELDARGHRVLEARRFYSNSLPLVPGAIPNAAFVTYVYDALGRLVQQTLPNSATRTEIYTPDGKTVTGSGFAPVTYRLDGHSRIFRTQRTIGNILESVDATFDAAGRIVGLSLQDGAAVHAFTYDTLGRLIAGTDPDIGPRTHTWTDAGWLSASANGAGQTASFGYDSVGRLLTQRFDDGTTYNFDYDVPGLNATYTAGRLSTVQEPNGTVSMSYDDHGRRNLVQRTIDNVAASEAYSYSPAGLLLRSISDDGIQLDYTYDAVGRLLGIGTYWQAQAYNAEGDILAERYGNGLTQTTVRDLLSMPTGTTLERDGEALLALTATYTPYGAIARVVDTDKTGLDHTATYSYDQAGRVAQGATGGFSFAYTYDGLQNLTSRTIVGPQSLGGTSGAYEYSGTGPRQLTQAGSLSMSYDKAGRTKTVGSRSLSYNSLDRLTGISNPGQPSEAYAYGYDGVRVRTKSSAQDERIFSEGMRELGGTRQHYVRVGDRIVAEVHTSGAKTSATAGSVSHVVGSTWAALLAALAAFVVYGAYQKHQHAWLRVTAGVLLLTFSAQCQGHCGSVSSPGQVVMYTHPALGAAPALVTDSAANILDERLYEPFGMAIAANLDIEDTGAANARIDAITHWADHGARWEAPELARWLTPDTPTKAPSPAHLEAPWDLNPYQMLRQNPLLYKDPDGHFVHILIGAAVGGAMGAGVEAATEYLQTGHFDGKRIAAQAVGGAIAGGVGAATAGASLLVGVGSAAAGNVLGQATSRRLLGKQTTLTDVTIDAAVGVLSFGAGSLTGKLRGLAFKQIPEVEIPRASTSAAPEPPSAGLLNDANHIFGQRKLAGHGLAPFLETFKGDSAAATRALIGKAQELADQGVISGIFGDTNVQIAGHSVTIRGRVIDGIARIGTAFITPKE